MPEILQQFERNRRGRDFVVGDLHGCFHLLRQALVAVQFDRQHDRLFSVGDLIDRGPHSEQVLQWLAEPWFHACLGNHEEMALESPRDPWMLLSWVANGGDWWLHLAPERQPSYLAAFVRLPLAMEIDTAHGRVGVVHADVAAGYSWPGFVAGLRRAEAPVLEAALWGRERALDRHGAGVEGIARVVCGHTIMPGCRVHTVANVWHIDTGAGFGPQAGGCLTLLSLERLFSEAAPLVTVADRDAGA